MNTALEHDALLPSPILCGWLRNAAKRNVLFASWNARPEKLIFHLKMRRQVRLPPGFMLQWTFKDLLSQRSGKFLAVKNLISSSFGLNGSGIQSIDRWVTGTRHNCNPPLNSFNSHIKYSSFCPPILQTVSLVLLWLRHGKAILASESGSLLHRLQLAMNAAACKIFDTEKNGIMPSHIFMMCVSRECHCR